MIGATYDVVKERIEYLEKLINDETIFGLLACIVPDVMTINMEQDEHIAIDAVERVASMMDALAKHIQLKGLMMNKPGHPVCQMMNFVNGKVDLTSVIKTHTPLEETENKNILRGKCIFCQAANRMMINTDKQVLFCLECCFGGNVIYVLCKLKDMSPIDTVRYMVKEYNIDVPLDMEERELWLGN